MCHCTLMKTHACCATKRLRAEQWLLVKMRANSGASHLDSLGKSPNLATSLERHQKNQRNTGCPRLSQGTVDDIDTSCHRQFWSLFSKGSFGTMENTMKTQIETTEHPHPQDRGRLLRLHRALVCPFLWLLSIRDRQHHSFIVSSNLKGDS